MQCTFERLECANSSVLFLLPVFPYKRNKTLDPGIGLCISVVREPRDDIIDNQTVMGPVNTGTTQHPVNKDRVITEIFQSRVVNQEDLAMDFYRFLQAAYILCPGVFHQQRHLPG